MPGGKRCRKRNSIRSPGNGRNAPSSTRTNTRRCIERERRRSGRLLGRAGEAHRLAEAVHQGQEHDLRLSRRLHKMVRGRRAERLGELHRPAPEGPRRPGRHHLGRRRPEPGQEGHLSRAARACLPARQRDEGARREARRPRHDLHADDSRGRLRDARLHADRRGAFRGVRRLLAGFAGEPHRGLPLRFRHHRGRRNPRRQAGAAQGEHRQGGREGGGRRRDGSPCAGREAHRQLGHDERGPRSLVPR